ncbi:MAG: acyltransferase family protein, partial [Rhizobacter sp.]|nr:acyltransferase family protein [Rhizobacter sp.]
MTLAEPAAQPRLHALDAVRAAALLLGIALHATLSFIPELDNKLWPVSDTQKSTALAILMFLIHIFRMSVFFLVAGLLAHMLFHRLGLAA